MTTSATRPQRRPGSRTAAAVTAGDGKEGGGRRRRGGRRLWPANAREDWTRRERSGRADEETRQGRHRGREAQRGGAGGVASPVRWIWRAVGVVLVHGRERVRGGKAWGLQMARPFLLAKFGQREEHFGQPDGLAIRLASPLEHEFLSKLLKLNLESRLRRLLEML